SPDPDLINWDRFSHWQSSAKAVRNRKRYFIDKFSNIAKNNGRDYQVLNVGSGPARDIYEFFTKNPAAKMTFHCVDMDENAITYAQNVCQNLTTDQIAFHHSNIFRFKNEQNYDLIWSAGLFDYLDDKKFVFLFKRLLAMLNSSGTIIIGNVSPANTSRPYMEFGEWFLFHRNKNELQSLAQQCGLEPDSITIEQESEGYNLFLVVNK
ncbi:methyltransferase domain-containing protein, partial [bacterium]|nr:methyltransferase domain-containing protein [bacterium]